MRDARKLFSGLCSKRAAVEEIEGRINAQYAALLPGAVRYDIERTGGGDRDRTERILDRIDGIKARQRDIVESYLSDIELAYTVIGEMENPTEARVLLMYYLGDEHETYETIGGKLNYSGEWIRRIHHKGIQHAQTILDNMGDERIAS